MSLKPNLGKGPDLLCIGPQHCGTTWIYCNLRKNPHVHTVVSKEIHYFDPFYIPQKKFMNIEKIKQVSSEGFLNTFLQN